MIHSQVPLIFGFVFDTRWQKLERGSGWPMKSVSELEVEGYVSTHVNTYIIFIPGRISPGPTPPSRPETMARIPRHRRSISAKCWFSKSGCR